MFEKNEIKKEVKNISGQNMLRFGNRVINLSHVIEIDSGFDDESGHTITFKYIDGTTYKSPCGNQAMHSKAWKIILHCLENGLFSLDLTPECHAAWSGHGKK